MFTLSGENPGDPLHIVRENYGPIQLVWSVQKDRPLTGLSVLTVEAVWTVPGGWTKSVKFVTLRADLDAEGG
jgi:hypothetical protein